MASRNPPIPKKLSALYHRHLSLGATMMEYEGWVMPEYYTDPRTETEKVRSSVGICDISPVTKIDVKGTGINTFLRRNFPDVALPRQPQEVTRFEEESTVPAGGVRLFLAYLCRLASDQAFIVRGDLDNPPSPSSILGVGEKWSRNSDNQGGVYLTNVTSVFTAISLAGPDSLGVLEKLTRLTLPPDKLQNPACFQTGLANVQALIVQRSIRLQERGEVIPSFDLYFGREYGEYIWNAILEAGKEFAISPFGLRAHGEISRELAGQSISPANIQNSLFI